MEPVGIAVFVIFILLMLAAIILPRRESNRKQGQ